MQEQQFEVLEHPPYSPDLAPSDFHLFGPHKHHLSAEHFPDDEAVEREVTAKAGTVMLEHWDCGFESHSRHGCLCAFILIVGSGLATT
jgi:hypothetical protein